MVQPRAGWFVRRYGGKCLMVQLRVLISLMPDNKTTGSGYTNNRISCYKISNLQTINIRITINIACVFF